MGGKVYRYENTPFTFREGEISGRLSDRGASDS